MREHKAYKFRVELTTDQEHTFKRLAGTRRFVYNWALARCRAYYKATGKGLSWTHLSAELTALKYQPGFEWLQGVDSQLLQQALADLRRAYPNVGRTTFEITPPHRISNAKDSDFSSSRGTRRRKTLVEQMSDSARPSSLRRSENLPPSGTESVKPLSPSPRSLRRHHR